MARNNKMVLTGHPHLVTFRTEQGLPFMPNKLINLIIKGNMAKAQSMYSVTICRYIWTPNHAHLIMVPQNPKDFTDFIGYVKRETANAINRLTGYKKRTIWAEGYDSPIILDFETCEKYCHYIDINPLKDKQERTLDNYPGVKSHNSKNVELVKRIPRDLLKKLPANPNYKNLARLYASKVKDKYKLVLSPDAWMSAFRREDEAVKTNAKLKARLREVEESLIDAQVVGKKKLEEASLTKSYTPKKHSPRMICLSIYKKLRTQFIATYKSLAARSRKLWNDEKVLSDGFFAPGGLSAGCLTAKEVGL